MSKVDRLKKRVEAGKRGEYSGLSTGIEGIESLVRGVKIVVGGGTGAGKSHFAVNHYGWDVMFDHVQKYKDDSKRVFKWFYYTLEMSEEDVLLRLASYILYRKGIYRIIEDVTGEEIKREYVTTREIGSKGETKITPEIEALLQEHVYPVFEEYEHYFDIIEEASVQDLKENIDNFYLSHGEVRTNKKGRKYYFTDKIITTVNMVDHGALLSSVQQESVKAKLDSYAGLSIGTSKFYKASWVIVQQLNRNEASVSKLKTLGFIRPTLEDFQDSGDPVKAAEVVYAVFNPARYSQKRYLGYQIEDGHVQGLDTDSRFIFGVKGREFPESIVPCAFYGEVGAFIKLPKPNDLSEYQMEDLYMKVRNRTYE